MNKQQLALLRATVAGVGSPGGGGDTVSAWTSYTAHTKAPDWYVATQADGGSDSNSGTSKAQPFATITKALQNVAAGELISVRGHVTDTYGVAALGGANVTNVSLLMSGTAANPIYIEGDPDAPIPVFDGEEGGNAAGNSAEDWQVMGNFLKFKYLHFHDFPDNVLVISGGAHDCTFDLIKISWAWGRGIHIAESSDLTFQDIVVLGGYGGGNSDGIGVVQSSAIAQRITFRRTLAMHNSDDNYNFVDNENVTLEDCISINAGSNYAGGAPGYVIGNGNGFKTWRATAAALSTKLLRCLDWGSGANSFVGGTLGGEEATAQGHFEYYNCVAHNPNGRSYGGYANGNPAAADQYVNCIESYDAGQAPNILGANLGPNAAETTNSWNLGIPQQVGDSNYLATALPANHEDWTWDDAAVALWLHIGASSPYVGVGTNNEASKNTGNLGAFPEVA